MTDCVLHQVVTVLGYLALSYLIIQQVYKLLKGFRVHILSRLFRTNLKKYGGWAVVTGVTDGIGKAYAHELARRGFDIVLISRTLEKLKRVAKEIEQKWGCKTKVIQMDFTGGCDAYSKIEEDLKGLDIGILVNNVGMAESGVGSFLDLHGDSHKLMMDMLNCNVLSMLQMTRIILPRMVQRKKGIIINLASEAGTHPYPKLTLYSATKVFMDFFSRSLNFEYRSKGIIVQSVMPCFVSTNMTKNAQTNYLVKTADDFAREALNTVGLTHRTSGCLSHSIQSYVLDVLFTDFLMNLKIFNGSIDLIFKMLTRREKNN